MLSDMRGAGRDRWPGPPRVDRRLERPGLAASPRRADARQCHRAGVGLSGGRIAGVGIADASMQLPVDLAAFDTASSAGRSRRVAHLSDLHVIGEQYGFRIESGRAGPRGNGRLDRVLAHLAAIHAIDPPITSSSPATSPMPGAPALGAIPRRHGASSGTCRAHGDVAGQSRRQRCRPRQSGAARSAFQPGQAVTANAHAVGNRGGAWRSRAGGRSRSENLDRNARRGLAPHRDRDRGACGAWRPAPCGGAARPVRRLSDDPAAGGGRRARNSDPELECGDPFFLHQCAGAGLRRTDARAAMRRSGHYPQAPGSSHCTTIWWNIRCR